MSLRSHDVNGCYLSFVMRPIPTCFDIHVPAFANLMPSRVAVKQCPVEAQQAYREQDRAGCRQGASPITFPYSSVLTCKTGLESLSQPLKTSRQTLSIWLFYVVPKLEHWYHSRFTLATLLASLSSKIPLEDIWQRKRQDRVDQVIALTIQLNNTRLNAKLLRMSDLAIHGGQSLAWLYGALVEDEAIAWIDSKNRGTSL
ncbi:hypothetical protein V8E54_003283 [Elaphomyces granulatus]